jgi:hypothetical protein
MPITVYKDVNFGGASKTFYESVEYVGDDWNDKISSVKVSGGEKWWGFADHKYLGKMYGPLTGEYSTVTNDVFSSLMKSDTPPNEKPSDRKSDLELLKDAIPDPKDIFDATPMGKNFKTIKTGIIITGIVVALAVVGVVVFLIINRKKIQKEQLETLHTLQAESAKMQDLQMESARKSAQMQLMPIREAADVIESHPESTKIAVRGAAAYGTGGASEVAPMIASSVPQAPVVIPPSAPPAPPVVVVEKEGGK